MKEPSDSKIKYSENNIIHCWIFYLTIVSWFFSEVFQQTVGILYTLRPSFRSPTTFCIHTNSTSYTWYSRFNLTSRYNKQPGIWKLSCLLYPVGLDLSCSWDKKHHIVHHICFLPRFTSIKWEELFNFTLPLTTNEITSIFAFLSSNIPSSLAFGG